MISFVSGQEIKEVCISFHYSSDHTNHSFCGQKHHSLIFLMPYFHCYELASISINYQRRQWHPTPVLLPGKSHGWRSLEGCSPWDRRGSDTTKRLHFHFSLSCIGEGNGNPLQCSCLENPRDGETWWAAVYGVAQSRTRLKRLSSSRACIREGNGTPL